MSPCPSEILVCHLFSQASAKNAQIVELNCFLHYYSRFKNHENSYKVKAFTECFLLSAFVGLKGREGAKYIVPYISPFSSNFTFLCFSLKSLYWVQLKIK